MKKTNINSIKPIKVSRKKLEKLISHDPLEHFKNPENVIRMLLQALVDANREDFYDILTFYLKAINKEELSRKSKIPIATIRRIAAGSNFNMDTFFKLAQSIREAA